MSVHQTKDGRWYCKYRLDGKDKRDYFGRGIDARKSAENRDKDLKDQGIIATYTPSEKQANTTTFAQLAKHYFLIKSESDLAQSTIAPLGIKLGNVILPELGNLKAAGLTQERLDTYVKKRLSTPLTVRIGPKDNPSFKTLKNPDGSTRFIKRTTVNRELCDIQAILNWAVQRQYLSCNPVAGFRKPKKDNAILKPPTLSETRAIMAHAAPHLIRALKLSFYTGLRPGAQELFRLTWADVNLDENRIFILSAKKNGIPFRSVPIHSHLIQDLTRWLKEDKNDLARHIITWKNTPIASVKHSYTSAKKRAGITRRIRLYDFRHAAVTNMLASGGDLKSVSEIAGHSRTDTTTKIYQHTNERLHENAIEGIPHLDAVPLDVIPENKKIIDFRRIKKKNGAATLADPLAAVSGFSDKDRRK